MANTTRYKKIKIGDVYPTNGGTDVEVIKLVNSRSITVKFLDDYGYTTVVKNAHLQLGTIRNPKRYIQYDGSYLTRADVKVGLILTNNKGETFTIIKRNTPTNFRVKFNDRHGYENNVELGSIVIGEVRNPYYLSVHGVGFFGEGPYVSRVNDIATKEYATWRNMVTRCYSKEHQSKMSTYIGCTVDEQWHNFQNFAEWYTSQIGYKEGWHLDKDLFVKGNRIYSSKTCVLLPQEINATLASEEKKKNTGLPLGIGINGHKFAVCQFVCGGETRDSHKPYYSLKIAIEYRNFILDERIRQISLNYYNVMSEELLTKITDRINDIYWIDYENYKELDPYYYIVKDCHDMQSLNKVEAFIQKNKPARVNLLPCVSGDLDEPRTAD